MPPAANGMMQKVVRSVVHHVFMFMQKENCRQIICTWFTEYTCSLQTGLQSRVLLRHKTFQYLNTNRCMCSCSMMLFAANALRRPSVHVAMNTFQSY